MKIKVFIIFFLAISAVGLVGYMSFIALSKLMVTLETTVQPDHREQDLKTLLYHISEAENTVRIFTITRETKYLSTYQSTIENSRNVLEQIRQNSSDSSFILQHLDTIALLMDRKADTQGRLIRVSQEHRKVNIYEELMSEFDSLAEHNEAVDSMKRAILNARASLDEEIALKQEAIEVQKKALEQEEPGFFQKIFGTSKKTKELKAEQNQQIAETTRQLDTLLAAKDTLWSEVDSLQSDDLAKAFEKTLQEIEAREEQINKELTELELTLTRRDRLIGLEIQNQTEKVLHYFDELDIGEARAAGSYFDKVTNQMTLVGTAFAMILIVLILIILNDIKVNQRYRKQLEAAKNNAERLAQAKEEFLSNMSHEIRTPLNAILGFIDQLQKSNLKSEQRKYIGIVHSASKHLLSLINDILDYAKIEAGKIHLEKQPFSILEQTRMVFDTLRQKAGQKALVYHLDAGNLSEQQHVSGDPVRYRQIIYNLLDNAIKFTEHGSVKLHVNYDLGWLMIAIADTGIGISQKHVRSIYDKFDQVSHGAGKKYGGTGLGLSIVKRLVEIQKGSIEVTSSENQGTEFVVRLPLEPTEHQESEIPALQEKSDFQFDSKTKILILDDEEFNRVLIETVLKRQRINFSSARSGNEALEVLEKEEIHAVLLDLQMDGMDGLEVARHVRTQMNSDVPLIAITASSGNETRKKCRDAGINEVLVKPISESEVLASLHKYLGTQITSRDYERNDSEPTSRDSEHLLNLFKQNEMFAFKMTDIYGKSLEKALMVFKSEERDHQAIRKIAHKILPSTREMGFDHLASLLKQLEEYIEKNDEAVEIQTQINEVVREVEKVQSSVRSVLESAK